MLRGWEYFKTVGLFVCFYSKIHLLYTSTLLEMGFYVFVLLAHQGTFHVKLCQYLIVEG